MENFIQLCLVYIKKYKNIALYIALWLLIVSIFIVFLISYKNENEKAMEMFEKAVEMEKQNKESREIIEEEILKVEKNSKLYDCYMSQLERLSKKLEVKENFCEENILEKKEDIKKEEKKEEKVQEKKVSGESELTQKKDEEKSLSVYRHEWNDERNEWLSYMYEKSWYDRDMILTFLSENDNMWLNRPSNKTWYDWNRAYWICQLYYTIHKDFINSESFKDPYKQIDYCIWVWNDAKNKWRVATTFYAYSFRNNAAKKLVFVK